MAVYAVKSEPFDNSDAINTSMGICMTYNGRPVEVHIIDTGDDGSTEAVEGLANMIYDKLTGFGF